MLHKLLFATTNQGKINEFLTLFDDVPIEILTPAQIPSLQDLEITENGRTFEENALKKATVFAHAANLPTIADDSGLQVQALGGQPGVKSARWFPGTDAQRYEALLKKMNNIEDRSARFVSVVCWYDPTTKNSACFTGFSNGTIARKPEGVSGFGYDPIFIPEGYTHSFAALGQAVKNKLSHRSKALKQLKQFLAGAF